MIALIACLAINALAADQSPPVTITQDALTATISNGIISATIKKANGNLTSLKYHDLDVYHHGEFYMNLYGEIPGQPKGQDKPLPSDTIISRDPARNGGSIGEVSVRFPYTNQPGAIPFDLEIRFSLRRGDSALYAWEIATHDAKYPPFNIEAGTFTMKLDPDVFDFLSVDDTRQKQMINGTDWMKGQPLNLAEARLMTTGIHIGEVEHKYDYSAILAQTPVYGWSSTTKKVGVWMVSASSEYISGGATKVDLTGHIDLKETPAANPTLLFVWHSNHYGAQDIQINAGDQWKKIIGPLCFYCNAGNDQQSMWKDAKDRAALEQKAWPYAWADAPGYPHAQDRGSVSGRLIVTDPQDPKANAGGAWVGLAQAPYIATYENSAPMTIDWQMDGKNYQYWAEADGAGQFAIRNARPGKYVLYAYTNGVLGDFSQANVQVTAGSTTDLGELNWTPVRYGKQLWDIGTPDRTAGEFRHGDQPWTWGLYNLYPKEFPSDVDYTIGKSDYRKDWNYAQPPKPDGKGGYTNTTWRIRFNMDHPVTGTATLRLAVCGFRGGPIDATLNGQSIGTTGVLPDASAYHRDAMRSIETLRDLKFDASLMKPGENIIELTKHAKNWPDAVEYDYLRLELDENG